MRSRGALGVAAAVMVVLAACGGSDAGDPATNGTPAVADDRTSTLCSPVKILIAGAFGEPNDVSLVDRPGAAACYFSYGDTDFSVTYHDDVGALSDFAVSDASRFTDLGDGNYLSLDFSSLLMAHRGGGVIELSSGSLGAGNDSDIGPILAIGSAAVQVAEGLATANGIALADPDLTALALPTAPADSGSDALCAPIDRDALEAMAGHDLDLRITESRPLFAGKCTYVNPDANDYDVAFTFVFEIDHNDGAIDRGDNRQGRDFAGFGHPAWLFASSDDGDGVVDGLKIQMNDAGAFVHVHVTPIDGLRGSLTDEQWRSLGVSAIAAYDTGA